MICFHAVQMDGSTSDRHTQRGNRSVQSRTVRAIWFLASCMAHACPSASACRVLERLETTLGGRPVEQFPLRSGLGGGRPARSLCGTGMASLLYYCSTIITTWRDLNLRLVAMTCILCSWLAPRNRLHTLPGEKSSWRELKRARDKGTSCMQHCSLVQSSVTDYFMEAYTPYDIWLWQSTADIWYCCCMKSIASR